MEARDDNTGAIALPPQGSIPTSGTEFERDEYCFSNSCIWTGLMTEEYHAAPYYSTEQQDTYKLFGDTPALSNATIIISEFNSSNDAPLFSVQKPFNYSLNSSQLLYLTCENAVISSDSNEFITGGSLPIDANYYSCSG